jgi:hypothetical protein
MFIKIESLEIILNNQFYNSNMKNHNTLYNKIVNNRSKLMELQ